jgi:hypothetical protein
MLCTQLLLMGLCCKERLSMLAATTAAVGTKTKDACMYWTIRGRWRLLRSLALFLLLDMTLLMLYCFTGAAPRLIALAGAK